VVPGLWPGFDQFAKCRNELPYHVVEMIRQVEAGDIPAIRTLMESEPGFWQPHWSDRTLARAIGAADGLAFVWESESNIMGFVCAHDLGFRVYLSELVVAPQARYQGIGRKLVRRVEKLLADRGHTTLVADVWCAAAPFYKSLGWTPPDVVLLRKKLGNAPRSAMAHAPSPRRS
jgi:predicted N-acetyltransferase YhbS